MIELAKDIYWDTNSTEQSNEALEWVNTNVISKLGVDDSNTELIIPELDEYKRPCKWEYNRETYSIRVIREYIAPGKWAKKGDIIKVIAND